MEEACVMIRVSNFNPETKNKTKTKTMFSGKKQTKNNNFAVASWMLDKP